MTQTQTDQNIGNNGQHPTAIFTKFYHYNYICKPFHRKQYI